MENRKNESLTSGQLALIELARSDLHREIDAKINSLIYRVITQSDAEITDGVAAFSSDTSSLKGTKPVSVLFRDGYEVETPTWKKVAATILQECDNDTEMHDRLMGLRGIVAGKNRVIIGGDPTGMDAPIQINDDLYLERKFDTASLLLVLKARVLDAVGYDHRGILIRYKEPEQAETMNGVSEEQRTVWQEALDNAAQTMM